MTSAPEADRLGKRALPLVQVDPGTLLRIHREGRNPVFFGRTRRNRFDDPEAEFGVLYAGVGLACCVAETIIRQKYMGQADLPPFSLAELAQYRVARLRLPRRRRLDLVDLTGPSLLKLGADAGLSASRTYRRSQSWSRAIALHPSPPHGLRYASRYDNTCLAVALFEPTMPIGLSAVDEGPLPDHPNFGAAVARYGMGLI
jgi:hypothetical protein